MKREKSLIENSFYKREKEKYWKERKSSLLENSLYKRDDEK